MPTKPLELVLGTAGHIDHGKTALIRALTGVDTDRLPEEKKRGITIDLGFAALDLGAVKLAIVDVPGHERFVRNMLAGASGLDLALLVVAADDSVMPQTREHLDILRLLGLGGGVVALTKCDLADPGWLDLVEEEVRGLVKGTFLEKGAIVRTSATTGSGLAELKSALERAAAGALIRDDAGLFRMAIDRAFTIAGYGTVVTGTVASGRVRVGDELTLWPEGRGVRVRGLQRHEQSVEELGRGSRAAINVTGAHHSEVSRGYELATPGYLTTARMLGVEIQAATDALRPLKHRRRYRLHLGTGDVAATLSLLTGPELPAGETGLAQLFVGEPVVAVHGEPFVLRQESPPATLGGGRILQLTPGRIRRRDAVAVARLKEFGSSDPAVRLSSALAAARTDSRTDEELCRETGIPIDRVGGFIDQVARAGGLVEIPLGPRRRIRLSAAAVVELEERVLKALGRLHAARPRQTAVRRGDLAAALPDLLQEALVGAIVERLEARGAIVGDQRTIALRDYQTPLSQAERKLKAEIERALVAGGMSPPDLAELQANAGARAGIVQELVELLVGEGRAVEVGPGLYLSADAESLLRRMVHQHLVEQRGMTMAGMRDLLKTSRKYAVPLGEYLDRVGLTYREGDERRLLQNVAVTEATRQDASS